MNRVIEAINEAGIVSFDLYDTLIYRTVNRPIEILKMARKQYERLYGKLPFEFEAEHSRQEYILYKSGRTFELQDIYHRINGITDEEKKKLYEIEVNTEIDNCFPSRMGMEVYNYAKKCGKHIIITTDMYLPKEVIKQILTNCGYILPDEDIFISSTIGKWKSQNGSLYKYVQRGLGFEPKEFVHLGDNAKNDVLYAKLSGWNSFLINNGRENGLIIKPRFIDKRSKDFAFGYDYFGALTLGYVTWVHEQALKLGIEKLYFFAREGKIYKHIYDLLYKDIDSDYLFVSRKALKTPLFANNKNMMDLLDFAHATKMDSIEDYLHVLGLNDNVELKNKIVKEGYELNSKILQYKGDNHFFQIIYPYIKNNSDIQSRNIGKYLKSKFGKEKKIGVVDIGWSGSMQYSFEKNCNRIGINNITYGFFFGQLPAIKEYLDTGMRNTPYLFSYTDTEAAEAFKSGTQLLEAVYFANHGTTVGYNEVGEPELADTGIDETVANRLLDIQDGIVQFAKDFGTIQTKYHFIQSKTVRNKTVAFLKNPRRKIIELVGDLKVYDIYSVQLVQKISDFSISSLKDGLRDSAWKNAFVREYINLPSTYWLYQCIRHVAKKFL